MRACVDIGGTKVSVSLHAGGDDTPLLAARIEPTVKTGTPDAVARQVVRMVDEACAQWGLPPQAVTTAGVCAPGPFVREGGAIALASPNLCGGLATDPSDTELPNDWRTVPLEAPLRQHEGARRAHPGALDGLR